jgi:hypothetical protein
MNSKFYSNAIQKLRPGCGWGLSPANELQVDADGDITNLWWAENNTLAKPTVEEIETAAAECLVEWEQSQYQRNREPEYPPVADLADALYWQAKGDDSKMTAYLAAVEAVKQKYPKGV